MVRRVAILVAIVLSAAVGVAAASLLTANTAVSQPPIPRDELAPQTEELGARAADPAGGPSWAVRILDRKGPSRCIAAVRAEDGNVGLADEAGRVRPTPPVRSGSCVDPGEEPLQMALASFAGGPGGPRSVLLAFADASVASAVVVGPDGSKAMTLGASRTFLVVHKGLSAPNEWRINVTLRDGSSRTYHL